MTNHNYQGWKQCRNLANRVACTITEKKFELEILNQAFLEQLNRTHNAWASMGWFFVEEPYRQKEKELEQAEQSLILALEHYTTVYNEYEALVQHTRLTCKEIERSCDHHV